VKRTSFGAAVLAVINLAALALPGLLAAATMPVATIQERGASHPPSIAFVGVAVVHPESGRVDHGRTVLVEDGRFTYIGPVESVQVPPDALVIAGDGSYLVPGLADMHVHVYSTDDFTLYLANGVTTIRTLGGPTPVTDSILSWRSHIDAGELAGPAIVACSNWLDGDPPVRDINTVVATPDAARDIVPVLAGKGYDCLKVYANLAPDVYRALLAAAHEVGIPVAGHVPRRLDVRTVLREGQSSIAHAAQLLFFHFGGDTPDDAGIEAIAREIRQAGAGVTTTLAVIANIAVVRSCPDGLDRLLSRPEVRYADPGYIRYWKDANPCPDAPPADAARRNLELTRRIVAGLHAGGVPLMLGTDASVSALVPGFSVHQELEELVAAGLSPTEALQAATSGPARHLASVGLPSDFGSIEPGLRADLLLVPGNPLEDLSALREARGVMARGRWYPAAELRRRLAEVAERNRSRD
jgi:imidazolonepropionase-like amidohydrolase